MERLSLRTTCPKYVSCPLLANITGRKEISRSCVICEDLFSLRTPTAPSLLVCLSASYFCEGHDVMNSPFVFERIFDVENNFFFLVVVPKLSCEFVPLPTATTGAVETAVHVLLKFILSHSCRPSSPSDSHGALMDLNRGSNSLRSTHPGQISLEIFLLPSADSVLYNGLIVRKGEIWGTLLGCCFRSRYLRHRMI